MVDFSLKGSIDNNNRSYLVADNRHNEYVNSPQVDTLVTYDDYKNDEAAYNAYNSGDYQKAIALYQKLALQTKLAAFYYNWGASIQAYSETVSDEKMKIKLLIEAVSVYKQALKLEPKHVKTHNNLGIVYFLLSKYENNKSYLTKAREEYETAIKNDSDYGKAHYNLGLLDFEVGNGNGVVAHLPVAIEDAQLDNISKAKSYYFLGVENFNKKDYSGAIRNFTKAMILGLGKDFRRLNYYWEESHRRLNITPDEERINVLKDTKMQTSEIDAAKKAGGDDNVFASSQYDDMGEEEKLNAPLFEDNDSGVNQTQDKIYAKNKKDKQTNSSIKGKDKKTNISVKEKKDPYVFHPETGREYTLEEIYMLGERAYNKGQYRKALKYFEKALDKGYNKKDPVIWAMIAISHASTGNNRKAIKALNRSIDLGFNGERVYQYRATLYYLVGEPSKTIKDLEKCSNRDAFWHYLYAMACLDLGDEAAAEKYFTEAIRLDPNFNSAYADRGFMYWRQGRRELAEKDLDRAYPNRRK